LTVGERISVAMKRLGLNDGQLAIRMGVSRPTVSNWRTDKHVVRHDKIPLLANLLGLDRSDLTPHGAVAPPIDEHGNTNALAYLRRIDNNVSRMSEDIGQVKARVASLESRVTRLEAAMHERLDGMQKQIDALGSRLDRQDAQAARRH
jgi:transcriptional regulator with XRE-family HTH domain